MARGRGRAGRWPRQHERKFAAWPRAGSGATGARPLRMRSRAATSGGHLRDQPERLALARPRGVVARRPGRARPGRTPPCAARSWDARSRGSAAQQREQPRPGTGRSRASSCRNASSSARVGQRARGGAGTPISSKADVLGQLVDVDAAVGQDAALAVDRGDRALARHHVAQPRPPPSSPPSHALRPSASLNRLFRSAPATVKAPNPLRRRARATIGALASVHDPAAAHPRPHRLLGQRPPRADLRHLLRPRVRGGAAAPARGGDRARRLRERSLPRAHGRGLPGDLRLRADRAGQAGRGGRRPGRGHARAGRPGQALGGDRARPPRRRWT